MERKDFIRKFAVGGSILFAAPALFNSCSDGNDDVINEQEQNNNNSNSVIIDLEHADFSALKTVGGYAYKGEIMIARTGESQYIALGSVCPHQGFTVAFDSDNGEVRCTSGHGSLFSTTGSVTNGPATTNLKKYSVKLEGTTLTIT